MDKNTASAEANPYFVSLFISISEVAGIVVFTIGCLSLIGWAFDINILKSVITGLVSMKANTAVAFILIGMSLWLQQIKRKSHFNTRLAQVSAIIATVIALLTLIEYLFRWDIGIDQILFKDTSQVFTYYPGRMSPFTAICFLIIGISLFLLNIQTRDEHSPSQYLILIILLIPMMIILGYLYPISALYKSASEFTPMAVHTAFGFILICLGILFARPKNKPIRIFTGSGLGGTTARHMMFVVIFAPIAADGLAVIGVNAGIYNNEVQNAIHVVLLISILFASTLIYSYRLERIDLRRTVAERLLQENKELLQTIIDNSGAMIYIKDINGKYMMVNRFLQKKVNIPIGKTDYDIFPKEVADNYRTNDKKVLETRQPLEFDETVVYDDGMHTFLSLKFPLLDSSGTPYAIGGISTDITDRKKLEIETQKAKHLESLGVLAGGIAHDFNNLLTAILGYISLSKMKLKSDDKIYAWLANAENVCKDSRELTSRLITFAKGGEPYRKISLISGLIKKVLDTSLKDTNIAYECNIADNLHHVMIDEVQIELAMKNIVINAKETISSGGTIRVYAENTKITEEDNLLLKNGEYIKVSIEDNGKGIPEENLSKIFEPYFTTKEMGNIKGSGLGLSIAYSIIKRHDGLITVDSKVGVGTTFHFYLPAN